MLTSKMTNVYLKLTGLGFQVGELSIDLKEALSMTNGVLCWLLGAAGVVSNSLCKKILRL